MEGSQSVVYDFKIEVSSTLVFGFFLKNDIFWFDIPVHDAVGLQILNSFQYLLDNSPDEVWSHAILFLAVGDFFVQSDSV